jgi:hypothetical protein
MKKMILVSVAMIASLVMLTNAQPVNPMQDDGFVAVELQDLTEVVQITVNAFAQDYDVTALQYNAEKQLTKVTLKKKADQTEKVIYLDAKGKEAPPEQKPENK